ncbi:MAG TPA: ElyC/SanA/YdcF family protein [Cyclobacteriaceae bacterium]|jgi:SanA protein
MRIVKKVLLLIVTVTAVFLIGANIWMITSTSDAVYTDMDDVPGRDVALVLGTSHRTIHGGPNPYFEKRIQTASDLYHSGKALHFILSGDNSTPYYNEPQEMKKALVRKGVPESAITLDYAGLRTLDSIVRSKEIFGQDKIVIITQSFHSYRALFISQYYDMDAVAMVAEEPDFDKSRHVRIREYFARAKAILDLYVLGTGPRFLGQKEELIIGN